jgi:predicted DNA-binding transcriptional regulator YafY
VELGFDDVDWLAGFLIGLGLVFEVLEPVELRRDIAALGRRLQRAHPVAPQRRAAGGRADR